MLERREEMWEANSVVEELLLGGLFPVSDVP